MTDGVVSKAALLEFFDLLLTNNSNKDEATQAALLGLMKAGTEASAPALISTVALHSGLMLGECR